MRSVALCIITLMLAHPLPGQELPAIADTATVRLWAPSVGFRRQEARFVSWRESSLSIAPRDSAAGPYDVPFSAITRLDVLRGRSTGRGIARGVGIGSTVGLLLGAVIGATAVSGCTESFCELDALGYMAGFGLGGAAAGGVIGAANPPNHWDRQDLDPALGFPRERRSVFGTWWFRVGLSTAILIATGGLN